MKKKSPQEIQKNSGWHLGNNCWSGGHYGLSTHLNFKYDAILRKSKIASYLKFNSDRNQGNLDNRCVEREAGLHFGIIKKYKDET